MNSEKHKLVTTISECMKLQASFNSVVNPDWIKAGYNWRRAMWVESAELVDMMGYKWWKNVNVSDWDRKQMLLEVVDIFHFLLSELMIERKTADEVYNTYIWATRHTYAATKERKIAQVEEFIVNCLDKQTILAPFFQVVVALDLSLQDVLKYYLGKNCLNKFRQDNGYKTGSYIKQWSFNDSVVEDNKVLEFIIESSDITSYDTIYNELNAIYNNMKGE